VNIEPFITPEVRDRLSRPTGDGGSCLPNTCYTDPAWLELENERLFARTWMFAGCLDQIAEPGDAFPTTIAGKPVVLVHGHDGEIRAFHNVCRHRGAIVVEEPCSNQTVLTCPYHAWAYSLDGALRTRPHFEGANRHDLSRSGPGLVPIRLGRWFRMIFLNLDGQAAPFEDFIATLANRLPKHDLGALRLYKTVEWEFKANWKLVFENYFDNHHIPTIHPRLNAFYPLSKRSAFQIDGGLLRTEYLIDEPQKGRGVGLPWYPGLTGDQARFAGGYFLFPSCCLQLWPDQLTVFQLFPIGPEHTVENLHIFLIGEATTDPAYAEAAQSVADMWDELNREDIGAIEWMQTGRHSPAFDGGVLSDIWDRQAQHFANLIVEAMT
tara:strand:+ start:4915 stop:6054 length:1140 start_codon:yes stop_codon:yes gene_type:complete